MSKRRSEFAEILPLIVDLEAVDGVAGLDCVYAAVERDYGHLVDAEVEPPPSNALRWKHDLRWELETLVVRGVLRRRKDHGRGKYSR
jgi:hypothetical protein